MRALCDEGFPYEGCNTSYCDNILVIRSGLPVDGLIKYRSSTPSSLVKVFSMSIAIIQRRINLWPLCYLWVGRCNDHEVLTSADLLNLPGLIWVRDILGFDRVSFWTSSDVHTSLICHPNIPSRSFLGDSPFLDPRFVEVLLVFSQTPLVIILVEAQTR